MKWRSQALSQTGIRRDESEVLLKTILLAEAGRGGSLPPAPSILYDPTLSGCLFNNNLAYHILYVTFIAH